MDQLDMLKTTLNKNKDDREVIIKQEEMDNEDDFFDDVIEGIEDQKKQDEDKRLNDEVIGKIGGWYSQMITYLHSQDIAISKSDYEWDVEVMLRNYKEAMESGMSESDAIFKAAHDQIERKYNESVSKEVLVDLLKSEHKTLNK